MSEALSENNVQVREPFICDNDFKAEWCLSKIRGLEAAHKRECDELDRQMQFFLDQKAMLDEQLKNDRAFFEGILKGYFESRVADGFAKEAKTQVTYKLPTGVLILKHRDPEFEYKKEKDKAVEFLEKNKMDQFVKVEKSVSWKELKPLTKVAGTSVVMKETGEVIPGITVTEREDDFSVEVK